MTAVGKGIFGVFLLIACAQDLRTKTVECRIYQLFGFAALIWNLTETGNALRLSGAAGSLGTVGLKLLLRKRAAGSLPGIGLLLLSRLSQGGIGLGDGCFFLISGMLLEPLENLGLLCMSVMLCGLYSLGYLACGQIRGRTGSGRKTVAFLPFVALAELGNLILRLTAP